MARKGPQIQAVRDSDPDDLLKGYRAAHLRCRTDRHRWSRQAHWFVSDQYTNERHTICDDCGTRRVELIDINTYRRVEHVRYRYPHGYLMPKSGLTLDDYRTEMLRQDYAKADRAHRIETA